MGGIPENNQKGTWQRQIDDLQRGIQSYKEDIARMRETLKNPNNKHLRDSYKRSIEQKQASIKQLQERIKIMKEAKKNCRQ